MALVPDAAKVGPLAAGNREFTLPQVDISHWNLKVLGCEQFSVFPL